jgi:signal transduction histidine kinase
MATSVSGRMSTAKPSQANSWQGGSEMASRLLAFDWSATPLGPLDAWPPSLKTAVATCLHSRFQMAIYWGPELNCIYNDAERDILGRLHPAALGMPARELLRDSWEVVGPQLQAVMGTGEATWAEDQALTFDRRGTPEVGYFTYSYSPILDDLGDVGGVLLVSQDTTARVLAERRLDVLRELATGSMDARTQREACELAAKAFDGRADIAFALIYLIEGDRQSAVCTATSGVSGRLESPRLRVKLEESPAGPAGVFERLAAERPSGMLVNSDLFIKRDHRPKPRQAFASTISRSSTEPVAGFFVAGVNDEFVSDSSHQSFLELITLGIGRSVGAARAREAEREHARSVAALDRAKTALFSNASHELRTPLALVLGPLDQLLDDASLPASAREPISVARRSAARMLKLVNALLDFSLIEAGERGNAFRPTDLAQLTRDLAAMFRSTAEGAKLRLSVDCPPLDDQAYVDREAWERIVSNLLSNALKFTPQGSIDVRLREEQGHFVLTVEDTGIGIAYQDQAKIFSRFYRGSDPRARTHEGSGIGLALVRELVHLHGGTIAAQTRAGNGTRMIVRVPAGREHLSSHAITDKAPTADIGGAAALFVEEASGWLGGDPEPRRVADRVGSAAQHSHQAVVSGAEHADRVLVVEDNRDMRGYLCRLLAPYYAIDVARDGSEALEVAVKDPPSVVVTDVMLPGLDGFGLVHAIRQDPRTRDIPVMLISARADPDSRLQALNLGADDYVVKPFSARELVARLRAALDSSRLRSEDAEARGRERERALREHELRALLDELKAAQRRVAAAADAERRRIERNLHDGAQQRLMAIRLELGLLSERLEQDPAAVRTELNRLHAELNEALEELRELAHGLYPPLLASDGLSAALAAAAIHAAIPVTIEGAAVGRVPRSIESAAYFACLEALQNAAKHAGDGARATVHLDLSSDALAFSVSDDGAGFDSQAVPRGQGLINLRDRLGALGGSAEITSVPGQGTTVRGQIPLP